jgi:hypothetical protein
MTAHPGAAETRRVSPKRYEIVIRGRLGERFASGFEGVRVETRPGETVLVGCFADQAQLHGLLDRIQGLGIELVSVNASR